MRVVSNEFVANNSVDSKADAFDGSPGVGGQRQLQLSCEKEGMATLRMAYAREWEWNGFAGKADQIDPLGHSIYSFQVLCLKQREGRVEDL